MQLNHKGTFRSGPIKSLWSDSTMTGNGGDVFMNLGFDNTRSLSKDVDSKVTGYQNFGDIVGTGSGSSDAVMKANAAFTGNEHLGVFSQRSTKKIH